MLLRITDYCDQQCKHCLTSSSINGKHMSMPTLQKSLEFINKCQAKALIITGGEPTDHPQFDYILEYVSIVFQGLITVTTHGMYLSDRETHRWFKTYPDIMFQITNDDRYYPKPIDMDAVNEVTSKYKNVYFCDRIGGEVYPQGRAVKYMKITHQNSLCKGTRCFNLRSISYHRDTTNMQQVIAMLEGAGKFCTPNIRPDGSIGMGESSECPPTSYVRDSPDELYARIRMSQCNDCQMLNKLSPLHWHAIGYHKR